MHQIPDFILLKQLTVHAEALILYGLIVSYLAMFDGWLKINRLITSVFHSVPGVPTEKVERLGL